MYGNVPAPEPTVNVRRLEIQSAAYDTACSGNGPAKKAEKPATVRKVSPQNTVIIDMITCRGGRTGQQL